MLITTVYLIASTLMFSFLALIWKNSDWQNAFVRWILFVLTIAGLICTLFNFNFIVRI